MIRGRRGFPLVLAIVLAAPRSAPAQAPAGDRDAAAAEAAQGDRALADGDPARALARYREAFRLYPSANLKFNMALAFTDLGRPLEAIEAYEEFLADAKDPPAHAIDHARKQIVALEAKVGRIELRLPEGELHVELKIDGERVGAKGLGQPVRVAPGTHEISVEAQGRKPFVRTITVGPGDSKELDVELPPLDLEVRADPDAGALTGPAARRDQGRSVFTRWWFWTGTAVVVVATVATVVLLTRESPPGIPPSDLGTIEPQF